MTDEQTPTDANWVDLTRVGPDLLAKLEKLLSDWDKAFRDSDLEAAEMEAMEFLDKNREALRAALRNTK